MKAGLDPFAVAAFAVSVLALIASVLIPIYTDSVIASRTARRQRAEERIEVEWDDEMFECISAGDDLLTASTDLMPKGIDRDYGPVSSWWWDGSTPRANDVRVFLHDWRAWLLRSGAVRVGPRRRRMIRRAEHAIRHIDHWYMYLSEENLLLKHRESPFMLCINSLSGVLDVRFDLLEEMDYWQAVALGHRSIRRRQRTHQSELDTDKGSGSGIPRGLTRDPTIALVAPTSIEDDQSDSNIGTHDEEPRSD